VSQQVGIDRTLEVRQSTIDHLDGYIEGAVADPLKRRIISPTEQVPFNEWMAGVTDEKINELARRTREAGVWVVPTMFLWESLFASFAPESPATPPGMQTAPKKWVTTWVNQKRTTSQANTQAGITPELAQQLLAHRRKLLKALADARAPILMGTDSPQMFNVPGYALHRELRLMADAGLTPYQILESGTKNVGLYVE